LRTTAHIANRIKLRMIRLALDFGGKAGSSSKGGSFPTGAFLWKGRLADCADEDTLLNRKTIRQQNAKSAKALLVLRKILRIADESI
jgi:hypothetical protein